MKPMNSPLVSICVPNLNMRPYLQERVDTILGQTYSHWEMVISDNYSNDGSWEFFEALSRKDSRISVAQAPREGLYANWNRCIERATGKYVYIATSDDTMAPDCIEKLVAALERNPDCDLAHCALRTIDSNGESVADPKWPECTVFAHGTSEVLNLRHVRRAPYDGLLHLTGHSVYQSITELLIRRSLFARIGLFVPRWGSIGDVNWNMKAGLVTNTVHIPDTWASYRVHTTQATASVDFHSDAYANRVDEMIDDAIVTCGGFLAAPVIDGLKSHWLELAREMRRYYSELRNRRKAFDRRMYQLAQFVWGRRAVRSEMIRRIGGRRKWPTIAPTELRLWLESLGIGPVIVPEASRADAKMGSTIDAPAFAGHSEL
jgi:glycosyltransferase involved in cell wall biosynthesis